LRDAQLVGLNRISDNHKKRSKIFEIYELKNTGRFEEGEQHKKCPKKCASCTNFWA
jgi:hypothetical protein